MCFALIYFSSLLIRPTHRTGKTLVEEQWEKDLEAELKDYEVVEDGGSRKLREQQHHHQQTDNDDELPTISNLRTRTTNNDWEEYADLIEDTDDLK